ncbi:glutamate receptor-like [Paramacrobiotus metropolitanus]|uniref:glutamate receptor-like n=1 Tax=Paramacrobiotus metropolitanus TaxID=2943436 RepID=UPI002445B16D|nr:glutamate receptor-like [Paramacrobiotus metropolitanus]
MILMADGCKVCNPRSRKESPNKLTVATIIETPYVFWSADSPAHHNTPPEQLQGNTRFDGFLIELLGKIATKANFTYAVQLVKDGQYGWVDEDGQWKGMIGELVRKEVDIALAPLTIMDQRNAVVDFTVPFLEFGAGILTKKPQNSDSKGAIKSLAELANQTDVEYGVIGGGATFHFFRTSEAEPFKTMWTFMNSHPYVFAGSFFEALDRVRQGNGKYAAILETPVIEFASNHLPCDTVRAMSKVIA